jgi:DNA-directed RNA polymerase specialized sigma24 family protein
MRSFTKRRISPKMRREEAFQAAWEELVGRYGAILQGQVRRSLRNAGFPLEPEQVEERVQEVYYRLLMGGAGRLRRLRRWSQAQVVAYLSRISQRVVVDEVRAQAAAKRGGLRHSFVGRLSEVAERTADPRGNPEEEAILAEGRRLLLERCRLFAESMIWRKDRERCLRVLRLALLEGWSSREISRAEGGRLAASTVDSLVHRARRRLARGGLEVPSRRRDPWPLVSSPRP